MIDAVHITAYDMNGELVHDSYVSSEKARYMAKLLKEEMYTVKEEQVTELPKGISLG